jgi:predicted nuclease of restriction endonuclease-like RecB superfamily
MSLQLQQNQGAESLRGHIDVTSKRRLKIGEKPMLTADLVRSRLRWEGTELRVEMLNVYDVYWQQTAGDLIALFRQHTGSSLSTWEKALEIYEGQRTDYIVIRGLAKVLYDAATFTPLETPQSPVQLREKLFTQGPAFATPHLFHLKTRQEIIQELGSELGISSEQVEEAIFADRPANAILRDLGPAWTQEELLARYNLELARGVLYWASHIQIEASSNYKALWRSIKFFKLMFWAQPKQEGGYCIDLDGPISPFVSSTLRYGRQMAAFLPALLLCEQWRLLAHVRPPQAQSELIYRLDHTSALRSHFKRMDVFDSRLEADFAEEFEQKIGSKRGHWQLRRESDILLLGDTVMIPDFTLVDEQDANRMILIELVGFWHPNYLRRKIEKVRAANCAHLLLLVYKGLNVTEEDFSDSASEVIFFQQKPVIKEVMEAAESMAERLYGPRPKPERSKRPKAKKQQEEIPSTCYSGGTT